MAKTNYYNTTSNEKNRLNAINEHVSDNRLDEEPIIEMEYNLPASRIALFDNCDIHYGGQGYESERADLALELEQRFFNGVIGIGGDYFDNANVVGKTNPYGARVAPADAMAGAYAKLNPIKDKIAFVIGGNHDANWGERNKASNIGLAEELARSLDVPYAKYAVALKLNLLEPQTHKVKQMTVCIKHEVGDPQNYIAYLSKKGIFPDVIIREHLHDGKDGVYMVQRPVYKKGVLVGYENHQVTVLTGKSMQNASTYYGSVKSFGNKTNVKGILLGWEKNPYYTSNDVTEPKYVVNANIFDVLHKNENKPSLFCDMLLKKYEMPSIETFKNQYKNKPLSKIVEKLDEMANN